MSPESYIGSISTFAGHRHFIPQGWAACNGQELEIRQYTPLYAVIGTTYGGDPRSKFNLPNLNKGKAENEPFYVICIQGLFPSPQ
jgi:microcystin-dependent protein